MSKVGRAYLAETAIVQGDVTLGAGVNIWHHCVVRGDVAPIRLGDRVNVQDGTILHCRSGVPLEIAPDVAIGHQAVVHCQSVGSRTLIGIRAVLLDDCEIGENCLIAAGALVPPRTVVPDGSVVMGIPGKVVRTIRPVEEEYVGRVLESYLELARAHAAGRYSDYRGPDYGETL